MSPTSTMPIPTTAASNAVTHYTKDQFASKQLIACYDTDAIVIQNVVLAFNHLLATYPQWSSDIALVFFANGSNIRARNVYFYPNLDKEVRDTLEALAVVKISLLSTSLGTNDSIPTLVALNHTQCSNHIAVDATNFKQMADMLNQSLSTKPLNTSVLLNVYKNTQKRLFLFDYDGTLTPIVSNPADAQPTPTLLNHLNDLCKDPSNTVWIISGRDQVFLDTYLGKIPRLGLSAEHGSFMKKAGLNDWTDMLKDADMSWKDTALKIFEKYTNCNPGTVIEQKKSSITWHYRNASNTQEAERQSELCHQELIKIPGVDILVGKMNLEVRSLLVNKGEVVKRIKQKQESDFIMCAGDDQTDEDMFSALKDDDKAFCVSVGPLSKITLAKYCVEHSEDVVDIIGQLVSNTSTL
ncbi:hypothetical protein MAM1_0232c08449 [Mucor ambiguus]|uniref:Trehalose 6-phosphate phosphatase n=1 Tax=Mucor ambiguus TaxID=91626 RepID=A0A0C9MN79_9FUNG|nr:hypothetical protein MAM1_0232c08449 [Mucor ambiguus]